MTTTPTVTENPGGWYEIDGLPSWHGSDHPGYLRAIIRTSGASQQGERARAVLAYVEQDTPRIVRAWRNWRARG